jgi:hypothetical protein
VAAAPYLAGRLLSVDRERDRESAPELRGDLTMNLFELGILLTTAGVSGVGCAALCGAVLDRIGRVAAPQALPVGQRLQAR